MAASLERDALGDVLVHTLPNQFMSWAAHLRTKVMQNCAVGNCLCDFPRWQLTMFGTVLSKRKGRHGKK
jgi:hypothetical protein